MSNNFYPPVIKIPPEEKLLDVLNEELKRLHDYCNIIGSNPEWARQQIAKIHEFLFECKAMVYMDRATRL